MKRENHYSDTYHKGLCVVHVVSYTDTNNVMHSEFLELHMHDVSLALVIGTRHKPTNIAGTARNMHH